jgi:hypothetical protein
MVSTRRRTLGASMPAAASALAGVANALLTRADTAAAAAAPATPPYSPPAARRTSVGQPSAEVDLTVRGGDARVAAAPSARSALPNLALLCVAGSVAVMMLHVVLQAGIVAGGLVAPAWGTFKALERRPGAPAVERWACFWVLAAAVFAADRLVLDVLLRPWLPGPMYPALLFFVLVWLSRDDAGNALRLYDGAVAPLLLRYEEAIDAGVMDLSERVDDASRYGLIKVSDCIRPIALQLEHAADAAASVAREKQNRVSERRGRSRRRVADY